jgi:preprotein translocase SecE subunit
MASNRQKAKARQARRREQQGNGEPAETPQLSESEAIRAGVPPVDAGQAGGGVVDPGVEEIENDPNHFDPEIDDAPDAEDLVTGPRGHRGDGEEQTREGSRVVQFLRSVVAELRRVQWPNREQLTTLTGVVLGFVLIAGTYLGLLDALFNRLIKAIL